LVLSKSRMPQASEAVMLSEAKYLWSMSAGVSAQKGSAILRFAQNDIVRWLVRA
jgi:hypothetical protein